IYSLAETVDLFAAAHLNGQCDGAIPVPVALIVAPCIEVQEPGGAFVASRDLCNVSQIYRRSFGRDRNRNVSEFSFAFELSGGLDRNRLASDTELPARQRDVTRVEDVWELPGLNAIRRQPRLRVGQIHALV